MKRLFFSFAFIAAIGCFTSNAQTFVTTNETECPLFVQLLATSSTHCSGTVVPVGDIQQVTSSPVNLTAPSGYEPVGVRVTDSDNEMTANTVMDVYECGMGNDVEELEDYDCSSETFTLRMEITDGTDGGTNNGAVFLTEM